MRNKLVSRATFDDAPKRALGRTFIVAPEPLATVRHPGIFHILSGGWRISLTLLIVGYWVRRRVLLKDRLQGLLPAPRLDGVSPLIQLPGIKLPWVFETHRPTQVFEGVEPGLIVTEAQMLNFVPLSGCPVGHDFTVSFAIRWMLALRETTSPTVEITTPVRWKDWKLISPLPLKRMSEAVDGEKAMWIHV